MAVDRKQQLANTPAERFEQTVNPYVQERVSNDNKKNRAYQNSVQNDKFKNFTVGIKDIDESIHFYFNNVIRPSVIVNGRAVPVPIIYGNPERWKAVQTDGFYRDKNGKIQAPLIMFRRTSLEKNRNLSNKIDAGNPVNYAIFERKYTRKNAYDRLSALTNREGVKEYQGVVMPDYVTLNYSCIIFTDYIEHNNKIIEGINYASDSYWGDPDKFKFRAMIDSYSTTTDVAQGQDRVTRTNFDITLNGYIIPDSINAQLQGTSKFYSKSSVIFNFETTGNLDNIDKKIQQSQRKKTATRFFDDSVTRAASSNLGETSMTTEQINYLSLNNTALANNITNTTATFLNKTIATAPAGFTLGQAAFDVYINNTYIPNSQRTVSQNGSDIDVVVDTDAVGYLLQSTDEVVLVGKFN